MSRGPMSTMAGAVRHAFCRIRPLVLAVSAGFQSANLPALHIKAVRSCSGTQQPFSQAEAHPAPSPLHAAVSGGFPKASHCKY